MKCELRIVSGARAGHRDVYEKSYIGIGRHPLSDVRFDAEKDLDASTRHAALVKSGDGWVLRDLGSTNGTYVNGEKLTADRPLHDGDVLKFGVHGPEVSFHVIREASDAEVVMPAVQAPPPKASATKAEVPAQDDVTPASPMKPQKAPPGRTPPPPAPAPAPPSKTSVLRAEISHQRQRARWMAAALFVLVLGALGVVYWQGRTAADTQTGLHQSLDSLRGVVAVLQRAKVQADSEKVALQGQLSRESDPVRRTQLTARIDTVTRRSAAIEQATDIDYTTIRRANNPAIAILYVRFADTTKMWTGTAFSVNSSGLMLTNRHVVTGEDGGAPRDIAVQFAGSRDVHPARLVRTSPNADLATVQLESAGPFPAVAGFAEAAPAEGAPIALIGFPGGGTRSTMVNGYVTRVVPDSLIEVDAFSGVGASGSPIFDRDGKVIGIEFGGLVGSGGRAILGLPIARAMSLIR